MVPLRWVAEALGSGVLWDEQANAVRIQGLLYVPGDPQNHIRKTENPRGKIKKGTFHHGIPSVN